MTRLDKMKVMTIEQNCGRHKVKEWHREGDGGSTVMLHGDLTQCLCSVNVS